MALSYTYTVCVPDAAAAGAVVWPHITEICASLKVVRVRKESREMSMLLSVSVADQESCDDVLGRLSLLSSCEQSSSPDDIDT